MKLLIVINHKIGIVNKSLRKKYSFHEYLYLIRIFHNYSHNTTERILIKYILMHTCKLIWVVEILSHTICDKRTSGEY